MMPQSASRRHDDSTPFSRKSFWWSALLGLPAVNVAALILAALATGSSPTGIPFVVVAAALALVEFALLIASSRRYRVGAVRVLAAMLGNVVMTTLGLIAVFLAAFAIECDDPCDGAS